MEIEVETILPAREFCLANEIDPEIARLIANIAYWREEIERCQKTLALPGREQVENDPDAHPDARGDWQRAEEDLELVQKYLSQDLASLNSISN